MTTKNVDLQCRHGDPCRTLENAGFGPGQARALVDFIANRESRLVTSDDMTTYEKDVAVLKGGLAELTVRMAAVENEVGELIAALESKMDAGMAALDGKMDAGMAALDGKMDGMLGELRTLKWALGTITGLLVALGVPAVVALVRLAFFP